MSLQIGARAPLLYVPALNTAHFALGSLGGRYVVLAFLPPPGPERDAALAMVREHASQFEDLSRVFFGVLPDAASFQDAVEDLPLRWFDDSSRQMARGFHALDATGALVPQWVILDPTLRVLAQAPLAEGGPLLAALAARGRPEDHAGVPVHAPVLVVPRVLEPALCRQLIDIYRADGGRESGVMMQRDGGTVPVLNDFKKRRDANIDDPALRQILRDRMAVRLLPEIRKVFQHTATRVERYIVACYEASEGGYFRAHRDDTTTGTAHRRFAVSVNLNAEEFEGGDLRFPEFGPATYRPPTGGAVVFSCALLHEATPVTRGVRYAFLPFLYDEAAEQIRLANLQAAGARRAAETEASARP